MDVISMGDNLLVHFVGLHSLGAELALQDVHEGVEELFGKLVGERSRVLTKEQHLPLMGFCVYVALEAIFVATLFGAHLAVPSQFLEA